MSGATKMHPFTGKLSYSTDNISYTDLTDIAKVQPPSPERSVSNATTLSSPSKTKEFLPSWRDPKTVPFTVYLTQTQYNVLLGQYNDEIIRYYKVTAPLIGSQVTPANWVGQGFVTKLSVPQWEEGSDDLAMVDCEVQLTGPSTFTLGS